MDVASAEERILEPKFLPGLGAEAASTFIPGPGAIRGPKPK